MNQFMIAIAALVCACGTKQNPRACCTDAADCMNVGLPTGTVCDDGLLCRGNRCVEEPCTTSAECDVTAPYCVETDDGLCAEACTADSQCPGLGQTAEQTFCVDGGCAECRAGMNDCPADAPVCSSTGACVTCEAHGDCASGVCADGACARENEIAYVAANGAPSSNCERSTPCNTVARAFAVTPAKLYVLVDQGSYTSANEIQLSGARRIIGRGAARPSFTRSTEGPVFGTLGPFDGRLEYVEVFGAHGTGATDTAATGILCSGNGTKLGLIDVVVRANQYDGVRAQGCEFKASRSSFEANGNHGVALTDSNGEFDRCNVSGNGIGLTLDGGRYRVTNSFITRNTNTGLDLYSSGNGNAVLFNTFADNGTTAGDLGGLNCNAQPNNILVLNNILVRNTPVPPMGPCIATNSIIDSEIGPLKFVRPDSPPYDYHLSSGSSALDLGSITDVKVDIDGESRPFGNGADIGADELH